MDGLIGRKQLSERVRAVRPSGIRKYFDIAATMKDVISLGVGEPDFVTPEHIGQAAIESIRRGETHYTSNLGTLELRTAIAQMLHTQDGVTYDPASEVMVTVGVSEAIDIALRAVLDPGDEVLIPDPGYVAYEADVIFAGGTVVPVATSASDNWEVKASALETAITPRTKVILLGNPNNPTGSVISPQELRSIAALAIQHDLIVLSDEVYSRLVYGEQHVNMASIDGMHDRTILVNGFSKAYAMTGWRIGYVCAPPSLLEGLLKVHQYTIMCASSMAQAAALEAVTNGEPDVQAMWQSYSARRKLVVDGFNSIGLSCGNPKGAFYAFPSIAPTGLTSDQFAERLLREEHVAVVPGSAFGAQGEGYIRCSYCTAQDQLERAIERMGRFVRHFL